MNNFNNNTGIPNRGNSSQPVYNNNQQKQEFTPNCGYGVPFNQPVNYNYCNSATVPPMGYNSEKMQKELKTAKERKSIRTSANRSAAGLLLFSFISEALALILILFVYFTGAYDENNSNYISGIEPVTMYILNSIVCLIGFGISASIITKINHLRLDDVLKIKKVNALDTVKFTIASMGFVYVFNLLLTFMNMNLGLFGFENEPMDLGTVNGLWGNIIYFLSIAVVPPIIEEFAFRGAILGSIREKHGDALAIIISAVLFGFMHGNFIQTPVTFLTGLVLGYLTVKTNSIIPAIILHFVNNGWAVIYDILSKLTSEDLMIWVESGVALALIGVGLICAVSLIKKYKNDLFTFEKPDSEFTMSQKLRYSFTTPCMILFTIYTLFTCVLNAVMT